MTFSKLIAKTIAGIMAFLGFMVMLGTAGTSDYMDEIGVYYPISEMFPQLLIGLALFAIGAVVLSKLDTNTDEFED